MPDVNLVPMMDVLMTVLTFFIIVSMTLTGQQVLNLALPQTNGAGAKGDTARRPSLVVSLNADRQLVMGDQSVDTAKLAQQMQTFLNQHPDGLVILKADRSLDYRDVVTVLKQMRDIGGDRVSLAIDKR